MAAARKRDYAAEYARRQARAREQGFGSYYERRVAGVPRGERARARGHRGVQDFLRALGPGDLVTLPYGLGSIERDSDTGIYELMTIEVIDGETGEDRTYTFRNFDRDQLGDWIDAIEDAGAVFSPAPSTDLRRL